MTMLMIAGGSFMIAFVIITAPVADASSSRVIKLHFPVNLCAMEGKFEGIVLRCNKFAKIGL